MKRSSAIVLCLAGAALAFVLGLQVPHGEPRPAHVEGVEGEQAARQLTQHLRLADPNARARALADFFARAANPRDAALLRAVFDAEREHVDAMAELLLASWWARFDPESALAGRIPPGYGGRDPWVQAVVREWTRRDPEAALQAVQRGLPPASRQVGLRTLIRSWFESRSDAPDPTPLVDIIRSLGSDIRGRGEAIDLLLHSMLETRGTSSTIEFVDALPEQGQRELRRELVGRLAGRLAVRDADAAVALARRYAESKWYRATVYRYLANAWGWADGAAAVHWAASLDPALPEQAGTVRRAWANFVRRDRERAFTWMRAQERSPGLEPAYARYLGHLARENPDAALALLPEVESPESRNSILANIGVGKMKRDPESAHAWMEAEKLPEELRQTILAKSTGGRPGAAPPRRLDAPSAER